MLISRVLFQRRKKEEQREAPRRAPSCSRYFFLAAGTLPPWNLFGQSTWASTDLADDENHPKGGACAGEERPEERAGERQDDCETRACEQAGFDGLLLS